MFYYAIIIAMNMVETMMGTDWLAENFDLISPEVTSLYMHHSCNSVKSDMRTYRKPLRENI